MDITQHISPEEFRAMLRHANTPGHEQSEPDKDMETSYRNRCNSDRGRAFENLLAKGCRYYADRGNAIINKVYEPYGVKNILRAGRFIGVWKDRAEPDFKGVMKGGRAIVFEAKSTHKSRMQRDKLTDRQMSWLETQHQIGALSFVCIDIRGKFFTIPWQIWRDMKKIFGKKFLMPGDIAEYEVIYDGAVRFLEYTNGKLITAEGVIDNG